MDLPIGISYKMPKKSRFEGNKNPPLGGSEGAGRIVSRGDSVGVTKNVVPGDYLSN
jgi:hypothetical protein